MIQRVSIFLLTAVLFLAAAFPAAAQSQESGAIIVRVTDAATGLPIDNAAVFLLGGDTPQSSLTNAKGLLIFDGLQPAIYRVQVSANQYEQAESGEIELSDAQRVDVAVKLTPAMKTIAAVVAHSHVSVSVESVDENSAQRKVSQSLSDALNKIAGVSADTNLYGADSAFNISLRGANASQTAYSIDGIHVGGAAGQALAGMQDLFSGASVDFSPSALSSAGSVNFFTIQPTKLWNYGFAGTAGNYSNTMGSWSITGGGGKLATAVEHAAAGQDYPLSGAYYADQTGRAYEHQGGFSRTEDLVKANVALSPVSGIHYMLLTGTSNSSSICANATALLPCGQGPGNYTHGWNSVNSIGFTSLASHIQYNLFANFGNYIYNGAQPNRAVNGVVTPSYSSGSDPWSNASLMGSSTAGRHTLIAGGFVMVSNSRGTSTYNGTGAVETARGQRTANYGIRDRVKSNDKLALTHALSYAETAGAGSSLVFDESATWQPKTADVFEASLGIGSRQPSNSFAGTVGDPESADIDCSNGSVYINGPPDAPGKQSSLQYSFSWRHSFKRGYVTANLYRNRFAGQNFRAGVPFAAEPPSLFPNGPAAYLNELAQVWAQPTVCGSAPFDPSRVYISQTIAGVGQIAQGFDVSGQVALGKNVMLFPRYVVTNSYISSLDPRLVAAGSYYAPGAQVPHTPMHTAGLIVDGILPHVSAEWLVDAEYTSANNGNNLPGYTIYNAGLIFNTSHGSVRLFEANIFGSHTGLFTTYQGVNPMPLQGGGTFAYATTPLPPRSFTVQYQVRWHQHEAPPKKKA
jgi:hypothetical protein